MKDNNGLIPPPTFINILVKAECDAGSGAWTAYCAPDPIVVTAPSILNFQLVAAPEHVVFKDIIDKTITRVKQLSPPTVSRDGKMLTLSNMASEWVTLDVTLHLTDKDQQDLPMDPQIRNEPQG